jgi:hypothetical protein
MTGCGLQSPPNASIRSSYKGVLRTRIAMPLLQKAPHRGAVVANRRLLDIAILQVDRHDGSLPWVNRKSARENLAPCLTSDTTGVITPPASADQGTDRICGPRNGSAVKRANCGAPFGLLCEVRQNFRCLGVLWHNAMMYGQVEQAGTSAQGRGPAQLRPCGGFVLLRATIGG